MVGTSLYAVGGIPHAYEASSYNDQVMEFKFNDSTLSGGRWLSRSFFAGKPTARGYFGAAVSADSQIFMFGGAVLRGVNGEMFVFNPRTCTWRNEKFDVSTLAKGGVGVVRTSDDVLCVCVCVCVCV
jgi:hypothetical protein